MNMFQMATWYKGCQPVAVIGDWIIVEKYGSLRILQNQKMSFLCDLQLSFFERIQERVPLLRRLFRREVRCSCVTEEGIVLFFRCGSLYKLDIKNTTLMQLWQIPSGYSTPLNLTANNTGEYIAFFGDYYANPNRGPVNIYGVTRDDRIQVVYTFSNNTVRHIHNIVSDEKQGYYIFTGDDDEQAGIYESNFTFSEVVPVCTGDKQARSVIGFPMNRGIIYATDSVSETNHIYKLNLYENKWVREEITVLNGSCIYGIKHGERYLFSTTVESAESDGSIWSLFSKKLGQGILSDEVMVISVDGNCNIGSLGVIKKDRMPYKLFQYGSVRLVNGNNSDILCIYPVGVKKYDGKLGVLKGLI